MHKTSAWPLALIYAALVGYASLYPFTDWRDQGISPWAYLLAPWPKYWTGFDVIANVLGYAPLGFLLALSSLRAFRPGRMGGAFGLATGTGLLLSLFMETLQSYLPSRVASNVDLGLNMLGSAGGALAACLLERIGALARWNRFRARWFVTDARGALVLVALWPAAVLFPASVPFGLGQVLERLESALAEMLDNTPFLEWLPVRDVELQPLVPSAELLCVMLGALIPVLLGFGVIRSGGQRAVFAMAMLGTGIAATALSAALSYGPTHAWAWLSLPVLVGIAAATVLSALAIPLPRRGCVALVLLALAIHLSVLNQAPTSAYFAQTLQTWEQGRFIRFHGLGQWLGWLWPFAAIAYVLIRLSRSEGRLSAQGDSRFP